MFFVFFSGKQSVTLKWDFSSFKNYTSCICLFIYFSLIKFCNSVFLSALLSSNYIGLISVATSTKTMLKWISIVDVLCYIGDSLYCKICIYEGCLEINHCYIIDVWRSFMLVQWKYLINCFATHDAINWLQLATQKFTMPSVFSMLKTLSHTTRNSRENE